MMWNTGVDTRSSWKQGQDFSASNHEERGEVKSKARQNVNRSVDTDTLGAEAIQLAGRLLPPPALLFPGTTL